MPKQKKGLRKMVTLDPCSRLKTIYFQLVPTIIHDAEENKFLNTRSVIETGLEKLEERSYQLHQRCSNCGNCSLCEIDNIEALFLDARERLDELWVRQTSLVHEVNLKPVMIC
ncbi:MAG: hypothetical protein M8353_04015 [ANME-2 cluster archaeon]|nr:hypothetical protein [ANME-2 cluster archaeon]